MTPRGFQPNRPVALWLLACAVMVIGMVVLGGLTRLTGSGLSMVEWQPLSVLPPFNDADWAATFAKYQESPQFRLVNSDMDVQGFKSIFWLEFIHRLWGRSVGVAFVVPLVVFVWRRMIERRLAMRLGGILAIGAGQGLMGWLMVASGLVNEPAVSHFRLAAHLLLALIIFAALLWTGLDLLRPQGIHTEAGARLRRRVSALLALATITITWGAFVAGLHAGLIYDTFPLMGGRIFPSEGLAMEPLAANFVLNHATVQFVHRLLAVATVIAATALWWSERQTAPTPGGRQSLALLAGWSWVQAGLGVATLLLHVPVSVATIHQGGAVVLITLALLTAHSAAWGRQ